jgi:protein SCO1/2
MKKIAVICAIVFSSVAVLSSCGSSEVKTAYQCPMKCEGEKTYDKPGECPLCKMELKEVK